MFRSSQNTGQATTLAGPVGKRILDPPTGPTKHVLKRWEIDMLAGKYGLYSRQRLEKFLRDKF